MTPKDLIKTWVIAFNEADPDALAELYADHAINHQMPNSPVKGKDNIRKMFSKEFAAANMTCIIENIFEDGDWGILEWKDPAGLRGCGFFKIESGKIVLQRGYWDKLTFQNLHNYSNPGN